MAESFSSVQDLVDILERPKQLILKPPEPLVHPVTWDEPRKNGGRGFVMKASLRDSVAALQGVGFEIRCSADGFDLPSHIVLKAEYKNKPHCFARIDINASLHVNTKSVCGDLQFIDAGRTHFHDTRLHRDLTLNELFNAEWDLPVARPLENMPNDFLKVMEICGKLLHIENLTEVEEPSWPPKRLDL